MAVVAAGSVAVDLVDKGNGVAFLNSNSLVHPFALTGLQRLDKQRTVTYATGLTARGSRVAFLARPHPVIYLQSPAPHHQPQPPALHHHW